VSVPALVDDVRGDLDRKQLALDGDAFTIIQNLANAGAITPTSLQLDLDVSYEHLEMMARYFGAINRFCQFWIGDLLLHAERVHGETYAQIASATGLAEQTLLNRVSVCKNVPPERRIAGLSFSAHAEVAPMGAREQSAWLGRAAKGGWSRAELRARIKAKHQEDEGFAVDGAGEPPLSLPLLREVLQALLGAAVLHEDGEYVLVPVEAFARLREALGEEE
jgi:hypothetical protein